MLLLPSYLPRGLHLHGVHILRNRHFRVSLKGYNVTNVTRTDEWQGYPANQSQIWKRQNYPLNFQRTFYWLLKFQFLSYIQRRFQCLCYIQGLYVQVMDEVRTKNTGGKTTGRKTEALGEKPDPFNHSVHHKSHKEFHGIEPGSPRSQNLTQTATTMIRLRIFNSFANRSVLRRAVNQLTGPSFFILLYTQSHLSSNALDLPFNAFPLRSIGFIVPNNTQPVRPGS